MKKLRTREYQQQPKPKKKQKTKHVNEEEILPDIARMMDTEEAVQTVVTVLGIKVSEFQKAQEDDEKYGSILRYLRDDELPREEEAKYVIMISPMFEMYNGLLFLSRRTKNPRPV